MTVISFIVGLSVMMFLLLKTRLGAFSSMLIGALIIGVGSGLGGDTTVGTITGGFGSTTASIGIIIIFGTMLGSFLEKTNAAPRIAYTILDKVGEKNSNLALMLSGWLVSIPVFSDVAFVMLSPLYKAISRRTKFPVGPLAVSLALGLLVTNSFVPPTPAPLAVAGIIGLDIGQAIVFGLLGAIIPALLGWAYAQFYLMKKAEDWYTYADETVLASVKNSSVTAPKEEEMPSFLFSIAPILVPIILIVINTSAKMVLPADSTMVSITSFVGNSNIALAIGVIVAVVLLKRRLSTDAIVEVLDDSLKSCGPIIFITAAGGALASVIDATGMGESFADVLVSSGLPVLLIPFLISGISKFIQGSGSVAMIMAATLAGPLVTAGALHPITLFLAACAGSSLGSQVNNSFFWVFANLNGYDTKTGLKTLCVGQQIIAIGGLISTIIVDMFLV